MGFEERKKLYKKLETRRKRPLISYVTSMRGGPSAAANMAGDVIPELLDQLVAIPKDAKEIDLLVVSTGGDPTVAWRAMSLLRERFTKVSVLLPQAAYSAATLLALGADDIVMHPHANLGPVDPQITVARQAPGGSEQLHVRFGYQDLTGFLEFARKEVGLTDQKHLEALFLQFCKEVGTIPTGVAARGSLLSMSMGRQLLKLHMKEASDDQKVETIVEALNRNYFHHGYPVSRSEARAIGLKIADADEETEGMIWQIWSDVEADLKMREPFNPVGEVANDPNASDVLQPPPLVNIPANVPAQIAMGIFQQVVSGIQVTHPPAVDFEIVNAIVESVRLGSRFVTKGKILAARGPDGQVAVNVMPTVTGWQKVA